MKNSDEMFNSLLERRDRYIAEQKKKRKTVVSTAASVCCLCLAVLIGIGVWRSKMPPALPSLPDNSSSVSDDHNAGYESNTTETEPNIVYETIFPDWPSYGTVHELIDASNKVILGTVTRISFQMMDVRTGKTPEGEADESYIYLCTIYDIDTLKTYKGKPNENEQVRVIGGIEGAYEREQAAALGEREQSVILCLGDFAKLNEGETYLFMLAQYDDAIPTIVNVDQGIYNIADVKPDGSEQDGEITVKDIISSFGTNEWNEFESMFLRTVN